MQLNDEVRRALGELDFLAGQPQKDLRAAYDRLAPRYERLRAAWLQLAGAPTEAAMLAHFRRVVTPGATVLDAGAGTGALARRLLGVEPALALTMVDRSAGMLANAADVPGTKLAGDVHALPFESGSFDVVVCAWVLETLADPWAAVRELLRVVRPDGHVLYSFCSLPEARVVRAGSAALRRVMATGLGVRFLAEGDIPWHPCAHARRVGSREGLATLVVQRKCCAAALVGGD